MTDWQPPVLHHGMDVAAAGRLADVENKAARDLADAKLRYDRACRDARSDYDSDVAAIENEHRERLTVLWLDRQQRAAERLAEQERM